MKTTPHPKAEPPAIVTCPGCGHAHPPHRELGIWCTSACIQARLREGSARELAAPPKRRKASK